MTIFILMTGMNPFIPNELLHVNVATDSYEALDSHFLGWGLAKG